MKNLGQDILNSIVRLALMEDIRSGDITSQIFIDQNQSAQAEIIAKENCIICGLQAVKIVFNLLNEKLIFETELVDGKKLNKGAVAAKIKGQARDILAGERTALNFLSHLSGITTLTNKFVEKVKSYPVKIRDTRKTTPGLRILEKFAVFYGGGENHRFGLDDGILIKDNHISLNPNFSEKKELLEQKRRNLPLEIEVKNTKELDEAFKLNPDFIMLDNMDCLKVKKIVKLIREKSKNKVLIEASGNINLENVGNYAKTGVDFISLGCLTHSAPAIDFSLEIETSE
jgi:nicotinate-nucleotide pyrophosphorylase (carboxylating)